MTSDVGARMLVLRKLNGWSQRQLAKRAGVPHSAISMIEHGQVSPSVNSLKKVLDGVPISLSEFFSLDLNVQIRVFFKANEMRSETLDGITRTQVRTKGGDQATTMVRECYEPGADTGEEPMVNTGEEVGFVVSGAVELTIGGEVQVLEEGDGFYFERRRPHRFRNLAEQPAQVVYTIIPAKPKA